MRHEKEWHTCDRCGCEIKEMPRRLEAICRRKMSMTEFKMKYGEVSGYIEDTKMLSDELIGVIISESEYVREKNFDLCPKCRKDFERFMKNE